MARGYLRIGRWRGVPVLIHWSTPLGALLFSGFTFAPAFWLAFVGLVLLHELGHAWLVLRFGARVLQVEAHALGGFCTWSGRTSALQRAWIAWGGVAAQACVLAGAAIFLLAHGEPATPAGRQVLHVATWTNVFLIALNLVPIAPLDGATAWKALPLLRQRRREAAERRLRALRAEARADLKALDALEDEALAAPPAEISRLVDDVLTRAKTGGGDGSGEPSR